MEIFPGVCVRQQEKVMCGSSVFWSKRKAWRGSQFNSECELNLLKILIKKIF